MTTLENCREEVTLSFGVIKEIKVNNSESISKAELAFIGFFSPIISKDKNVSSLNPFLYFCPFFPLTLLQVLEFRVRAREFKGREGEVIQNLIESSGLHGTRTHMLWRNTHIKRSWCNLTRVTNQCSQIPTEALPGFSDNTSNVRKFVKVPFPTCTSTWNEL